MARRFYTILVIPDVSSKLRRISIPSNWVRGIIGSAIAAFLLVIFLIYSYAQMGVKVFELSSLRREAREQKVQIRSFVKSLQALEAQMARLERLDKKLRLMTALGAPEKGNNNSALGVGGPEGKEVEGLLGELDKNQNEILKRVQAGLLDLQRFAVRQELSFLQIDEFLKGQKHLLASTPSVWPTRGLVSSGFGYRISPFTGARQMHEGLDISNLEGSRILATADGVVVRDDRDVSLGRFIEIDHGNGVVTRYAHNSRTLVKAGQKVRRGDPIATVGSTGKSTGPHLHYEIRVNGIPVNPRNYIIEEPGPG